MAESDRLFSLQIRSGEISDDPDGLASTKKWCVSHRQWELMIGRSINTTMLWLMGSASSYLIWILRSTYMMFLSFMLPGNIRSDLSPLERPASVRQLYEVCADNQVLSDEEHNALHSENWASDMSWKDLRMVRSCCVWRLLSRCAPLDHQSLILFPTCSGTCSYPQNGHSSNLLSDYQKKREVSSTIIKQLWTFASILNSCGSMGIT
jgi:hypothetical protein